MIQGFKIVRSGDWIRFGRWAGWPLALLAAFGCARAHAQPAAVQEQPAPAAAENEPAELGAEWVRIKRDAQQNPLAMQTAIVRYTGTPEGASTPVSVDLIGAVHVGDVAYYDQLNKKFEEYDALLYELVAAEGTVIPQGTKAESRNPLGALQGAMSTFLELEHQLEKVDYTRPNFVHADMSPGEFFDSMTERGEGVVQMIVKAITQSLEVEGQQQAEGKSVDAEIFVALFATDRARRLKVIFAEQFQQMDTMLAVFGGEEGSTIITERNKKALEVLKEEIAGGKKKLGVFYGAGHLSDMHERLVKEFNLQPESITWVDAWDLRKKQ